MKSGFAIHQPACEVVDIDLLQRVGRGNNQLSADAIDADGVLLHSFVGCRHTGAEEVAAVGICRHVEAAAFVERGVSSRLSIIEGGIAEPVEAVERKADVFAFCASAIHADRDVIQFGSLVDACRHRSGNGIDHRHVAQVRIEEQLGIFACLIVLVGSQVVGEGGAALLAVGGGGGQVEDVGGAEVVGGTAEDLHITGEGDACRGSLSFSYSYEERLQGGDGVIAFRICCCKIFARSTANCCCLVCSINQPILL